MPNIAPECQQMKARRHRLRLNTRHVGMAHGTWHMVGYSKVRRYSLDLLAVGRVEV